MENQLRYEDDISEYIYKCKSLRLHRFSENSNISQASALISEIVGIFSSYIDKIDIGLMTYQNCDFRYDNVNHDLDILVKKLSIYLNKNKEQSAMIFNNNNTISNSGNSTNNNTQTMNNNFDIKLELDKVRSEIKANESLDDYSKHEVNEKLNEIEEVMEGTENNNEKWNKLKSIIPWVATKSYQVGKWIMPIITKTLFPDSEQ